MKILGNYFGIKISASILFLCIGLTLSGQVKNGFSFSGTIADSITQQPIEYASVAIYKINNTIPLTGVVTNGKGEFVATNLNSGKYVVKVNFMGYKTKTENFTINNTSVQLAEPVLLISSSVYLAEVEVTGKMKEKQVSIEKTRINVAQNMGAVSGNVTEVLKSQSSINIDADNNIYLRGNSNILVLMDGKPTTVSSLSSIPSTNVENIEIVTNPDAKYDAEGTGGIINIITKRNSSGFNAAITLNYGINNRINGGISANYSKGIWNLGFNYNARYERANIQSNLTRQFYAQPTLIQQNIHSIQENTNQMASMLISAKPNNRNMVSLGVNYLMPDLSNNQNILGSQTTGTSPEVLYNRKNEVAWSRKAIETALSYKKIFEKNKNEISFDAFYSHTKGSRPSDYYINNEYLQKAQAGGTPVNMTLQVDYFKQLFNTGRIETGVKLFSRSNSFSARFYDKDTVSGNWITNPALSSDLTHTEDIYAAYLMYSDSLFKKLFYKIGGRIEYNTSDLKENQTNEETKYDRLFPFPFLLLKYNINAYQNIGLSLTRRVTRPTYPQLMSYIVVIDQMTYETGNKNLVPEIIDKIELNHSWLKEKLQIRSNLYYSVTQNFIAQVSTLPTPDNLVVTYVNGNRSTKFGIDADAVYKIRKSFSVNPGFSVFQVNSTGKYNGIDLSTNNMAWSANIRTLYKPDAKTGMTLLLNYNSPIALPQFNLSNIYYADFGIKRNILSNKLSMSLTLTDIFNTRKWIIQSDNTIFKLHNDSKTDSRILWFGLTYNINSFKSVKSQKNEGTESEGGLIKLGQ
jgi:outer membrane receptor protein involved in Fe transport